MLMIIVCAIDKPVKDFGEKAWSYSNFPIKVESSRSLDRSGK